MLGGDLLGLPEGTSREVCVMCILSKDMLIEPLLVLYREVG